MKKAKFNDGRETQVVTLLYQCYGVYRGGVGASWLRYRECSGVKSGMQSRALGFVDECR